MKKSIQIVQVFPGIMGAGINTTSAGNAKIGVNGDMIFASVVAKLYRTYRYTGMTVDTFILINLNYGNKSGLHIFKI